MHDSSLSRRALLRTLGAAGLVAGLPRESWSAQRGASHPYDVAIIGGGFAGVTAAREARHAGLSAIVVEARTRLGGRTWSVDALGQKLELGGTWIGFQQPHVWAERTRYGIELLEAEPAAGVVEGYWPRAGKIFKGEMAEASSTISNAMAKWLAPAADLFPRPFAPVWTDEHRRLDAQSVAESLARADMSQEERTLLASDCVGYGHTFPRNIGLLGELHEYAINVCSYEVMSDNSGRYRMAGGTKVLLEAIARDSHAAFELGTPVRRVTRARGLVTIERVGAPAIRARAAIIAVPINTLVDIEFSPQLAPQKLAMSRERHTGSGTKIFVRVRGQHPPFGAMGEENAPLAALTSQYTDAEDQVWVGLGASPSLLDIHDPVAVRGAVAHLRPDVEVLDSAGYDWNADPYSRGTWCVTKPLQLTRYAEHLALPEGEFFFAGSDIAAGWAGYIDGAIETGIRSAREVIRFLGHA